MPRKIIKSFTRPVTIDQQDGERVVRNVSEARDALAASVWPAHGAPRHRDAIETCLKVIDGHRSTEDAEWAFREAAREAGILRD